MDQSSAFILLHIHGRDNIRTINVPTQNQVILTTTTDVYA